MSSSTNNEIAQYISDAMTPDALFEIFQRLRKEVPREKQEEFDQLSESLQRDFPSFERAEKRGKDIGRIRDEIQDTLNKVHELIHKKATPYEDVPEPNDDVSSVRTSPLAKEATPEESRMVRVSDRMVSLFQDLEAEMIKKDPNSKDRAKKVCDRLMKLEAMTDSERFLATAITAKEEICRLADEMKIPLSETSLHEIDASIHSLEAEKRIQKALSKFDAITASLPNKERKRFIGELQKRIENELPPKSDKRLLSASA